MTFVVGLLVGFIIGCKACSWIYHEEISQQDSEGFKT